MTSGALLTAKVAIILLNWNGWRDTIACLESVLAAGLDDVGLFLCDNASTDGSVERIKIWAADRRPDPVPLIEGWGDPGPDWPPRHGSTGRLVLIETGANLGFAGGNNVALRYALREAYEYFWLLNNDTEIDAETLPALLDRMRADPAIGMCGSTLVYAAQPEMVQNLGGGTFNNLKGRGEALGMGMDARSPIDQRTIEQRLRFVSGASMLVSRAFLQAVGLMTEDYFLYFEEIDWAERARGRFTLGYAPRSLVRHKVGASIGTSDFGQSSPLSVHFMTRNRVRFCWRFRKGALPYVAADLIYQMAKAGLRGDWRWVRILAAAALQRPFSVPASLKHEQSIGNGTTGGAG